MFRELGSTGIQVTAIGLGGMPLSLADRPEETEAFQVIETFVNNGGNFIDTANVYCRDESDIGHNERLIARALDRLGKRSDVIVATKGGLRRPRSDWVVDGRPAFLRESLEQSLLALGSASVTLYQLHAVDPKTGLDAALDTLIALREEGKIEHIGLSNITLAQLKHALRRAPIVSVQNRCNVLEKQDFRNGMVDFCREQRISFIPHSPAGGHHAHVRLPEHPVLTELAHKYGVSPYCLALAFLLAKGDHILPIPGASKPASIADSLKSMSVVLAPEDVALLDKLPDER